MNELKKKFALLVLFLLLVFSLELVSYDDQQYFNFPSHFYFFLVFAVMTSLLVPRLRWLSLYNLLVFWGLSYTAVSQIYFYINGYEKLQIMVLAFLLLETSIFIAYQLNVQLSSVEEVMHNLAVYLYPNRTNNMNVSLERIHLEVSRSRRHGRPLTVLVIDPEKVRSDSQPAYQILRRDLLQHFVDARMGQLISERARQTDMILRDKDGKFIVVCAETEKENSYILAERIQNASQEILNASLRWGVADFPQEALTFEELVKRAKENISQKQ
jgi:GGDEF domain-containing protein